MPQPEDSEQDEDRGWGEADLSHPSVEMLVGIRDSLRVVLAAAKLLESPFIGDRSALLREIVNRTATIEKGIGDVIAEVHRHAPPKSDRDAE